MNFKMLKAAFAGLVLSISGFASAGLIEHSYIGATGINVDTNPGSTFDLIITDSFLIDSLVVEIELSGSVFWTDLDLFLSNGFTTVQLLNSIDNDASGLFDVSFDDLSPTNLPSTGSAVGSYSPLNALSAFNGQSIAGTWTLTIVDDYVPGENNSLVSFNLKATEVPEPSTLAIFGLALIGLASRRFKK